MGRLIDADKLKAQVEAHEIKYKFTPTDYQYGHNVGIDKAVADIDDAAEVDAIPVEWIELHISVLEFIGKKESVRRAEAIRNMLGIWRYEQKGN